MKPPVRLPKPFHPGLAVHGLLIGTETAGLALAIAALRIGLLAFIGGTVIFAGAEALLLLSSW